ncbi:hypothetical protein Tco_0357569 [Tanacetum coccineum]
MTAKRQTPITPCLKNFKVIQKEIIFHSNKTFQVSSVFAITSILPTIEPEDSLIIGDKHLSTFRVKDFVPIPRESDDTSGSDSENVLLSSDDSVIFSNPSKLNLSSSSNLLPSCALVKKNMISEFAEALTPL